MERAPTSSHAARYSPDNSDSHADGRLVADVVARNGPPVIAALAPWLNGARGAALEIGSGTGQHAANFALAFPGLSWHASDPDPAHRRSADAWRVALRLPPCPARDVDASDSGWPDSVGDLAPLSCLLAMNVTHIAPPAVTEGIVAGAGRVLAPGGLLALYGPFSEPGRPLGDGNRTFDARLRADNPDWGLRDLAWIEELASTAGLARAAIVTMPADNRLILFRR
ncbi:Protein of unknown function [Tranquillimonas rosea]|uniref:DUF938 domain-containing protein n=1 Tax=Tranquillimonas rosea TaxID=641238 RepID=A0A1H9V5H0_9RHOB|nr:DUF938 domain-containing protein [Tranquillimonas rosea]SES16965.1 Protein of unknown function [Tranquillimonas rosea]